MITRLRKMAARWVPFLAERSELYVFGSSILWGQGILPEEKIHATFANWLLIEKGELAKVHMFAHSGARVLGGDGDADLHGEIPRAEPSVMAQVEAASRRGTGRVRILVEGGINDVGGTKIVSPRTSQAFINSRVEQACYHEMKSVLKVILRKFPEAEIYLFGYYPILAENVAGRDLRELQETEDNETGWDDFPELALRNSQVFLEESDRMLFRLAEEMDGNFSGTCRFVPSGFLQSEGMFGRHSLLFHPWDSDPLMGIRARKCAVAIARRQTGVHCFLASTAHPNEAGALRYAGQLIKSATEIES